MNNDLTLGNKVTANIHIDQPLSRDLLQDMLNVAGYCFTITTRYSGGKITACWADSPRKKATRTTYDHSHSPAQNHLRAAIVWLNSLDIGYKEWGLIAHTSTAEGYVFTFK